jgi:hypothetical protein
MISERYTEKYLFEFYHKVNYGNFRDVLFDRLLVACVTTSKNKLVLVTNSDNNFFKESLNMKSIYFANINTHELNNQASGFYQSFNTKLYSYENRQT